MVTISDVAARAHVGAATVSRVLNGATNVAPAAKAPEGAINPNPTGTR